LVGAYLAIYAGYPSLAALALVSVCALIVIGQLRFARSGLGRVVTAAGAALAGVTSIGLFFGVTQAIWLMQLLPVAANLALMILFGRTLSPDREPLVTRFCRLERGVVSPQMLAYTQRWTVCWTVFFALSAALSADAWLFADEFATWTLRVNGLQLVAAILLFLAEHFHRAWRYREERPVSPLRTLRTISRPEAWLADGR